MKNKMWLYYFFMLLPLLVTLVIFPFLPETIPAHYNFAGEVDRWGSKFETFIFPFCTIAMGVFMLWMAKIAAKDEKGGKNNEKIVFCTGMGISIWFAILHGHSLYMDFALAEKVFETPVDINKLICILLGIGIAVTGNFMPKLRNNAVMGLRTSWSMKNDTTWKKSQIFGGASFMIIGVLTVIAGIFFEGYTAMFIALGLLVADTVVCVIYTYKVAQKY